MTYSNATQVIIIGAGFTGLSAAYELLKKGVSVVVLEADMHVGGLGAAFDVKGEKLDRFYHHWFTNDNEIMNLIDELGLSDHVEVNPTNTGVYYANNFFKLSTPWDLLNFKPLSFIDRIRLGLLALRARKVKDWKVLESITAEQWLQKLGGAQVYKVIWQPLLKGKFGRYANQVSAVWFWNKLKLRGGSRGKGGEERLAYFKGSFAALAEALADKVRSLGGEIILNAHVDNMERIAGGWECHCMNGQNYSSDNIISTVALPLTAQMIESWADPEYISHLKRIQYIGNTCLVMELSRSLSKTYWLNVNDPDFPFVGVIEHTNFESPVTYGGRHIIYLSKYLPTDEKLYAMDKDAFFDYAFPFLKRMFPDFERDWVIRTHLWKAEWSQPVVEKNYSQLIPEKQTPYKGLYLCSMAQIYPEDRGTNYAVREGRKLGNKLACEIIKE